ncbi:NUDIX hydrolase [Tabrizicola thermarum]|uniref:NUDIX hydrolase n=1 Tax=Tabrizicola thermarum TaxID=2670345 RepID=UPI000FFC2579|nr:NUDIX hydrolase [Tabrizicola thermarum]
MDFTGAKAALFCGSSVLTCLRDDRPDLRWPGLWDLPGGGREGAETAEACLLRELREEFGLTLPPDRLIWRRVFPSMVEAGRMSVFFGGWLTRAEVAAIRFGDEGQGWELMPVAGFLVHRKAVPEMQRRAGIVWEELGAARAWPLFPSE